MKYDFLIVGSGIFGSVFAHQAKQKGKRVLVIDKRDHAGGNIYCRAERGINVHVYGAHIFHTDNKMVWDFVSQFVEFNNYINCPVANYKGKLFSLPFNMNTFYQMWGVITPEQARAKIAEQVAESGIVEPKNLEEKAISLVGRDIYECLIKGYTEKQWGVKATELPAFIISRLPLRFVYDNNYFNDRFQGIPIGGYNLLIDRLLEGIEVRLNTDFYADRQALTECAERVIFTGAIDEYFDYQFGELEYRSLRFEHQTLEMENYQGTAVMNFTEYEVPYTRVIEHKHFEKASSPATVVTREYPASWSRGKDMFYPINNQKNNQLYARYKALADAQKSVIFAGRLGEYKYYDMDDTVEKALLLAQNLL